MEPVRVVGCAIFDGPVFHGIGYDIGDLGVQAFTFANGLGQLAVNVLGQALAHGGEAEYIAAKTFFSAAPRLILA